MVLGQVVAPQRADMAFQAEPAPMKTAAAPVVAATAEADEDDTMSYFAKLAAEE